MPESRKRGGKKLHRKRVEARNQRIKTEYKYAAKQAWEKYETWKQQQGNTDDKGISIALGNQNQN